MPTIIQTEKGSIETYSIISTPVQDLNRYMWKQRCQFIRDWSNSGSSAQFFIWFEYVYAPATPVKLAVEGIDLPNSSVIPHPEIIFSCKSEEYCLKMIINNVASYQLLRIQMFAWGM